MATVSDDFNRANEALNAGPWTLVNWTGTSAGFNVVSNQCVIQSTNRSGAIHNTALATDDHQVQVRVEDYDVAVFARGDVAGTTGYLVNVYSGDVELFKIEAGVITFITSIGTAAVALGDSVFISVVGDQITWGKVGGRTKTITDTSITTGTRVGIGASGNQGTLDDFLAFDLAVDLDIALLDSSSETGGTLTLDATGAAEGARLCATIVGDFGTYSAPAGWALEDSIASGSNTLFVFSAIAGAGEGALNFTRTGGNGGFGRLYEVTGPAGTPVVDLVALDSSIGSAATSFFTPGGVASAPALVLRYWAQITATATLTPDATTIGGSLDNYWPDVDAEQVAAEGDVGTVRAASGANSDWFAASVAFIEAGGTADVTHGIVLGHEVTGTVEEEVVTAAVDHGIVLGHQVDASTEITADAAHGIVLGHQVDASIGSGADVTHGIVLGHQVTGTVEVPVSVDVAHGIVLGHAAEFTVEVTITTRPIQPMADLRPIQPSFTAG